MNRADMRQPSVSLLAQFPFKYWTRAKRIFAFPRSKLRLKLVAILSVTVLLGMTFSSLLVLSLQRQQLINQAQTDALHVDDVIKASLFHSMSDHDTTMVKNMIGLETSEAGLDYIRILDQDGTIRFSSNAAEVGQRFQRNESPCRDCHLGSPNVDQSVPTTNSQIIGESLVTVNTVANQPSCNACHSSAPSHLGLLLVATPMADLRAQLAASSGWLLFSGVITFMLLVGLMTPALEKFITRPVMRLAQGAAEISAGNLDYSCHAQSNDEIGDLATTFDTMRQRLKTMLEEKEQQNRDLRMLNEIARITSEQLEPQQILDLTIKAVVHSLNVEAGAIRVLDQEHGQINLHACQGIADCHPQVCDLRAINIALAKRPIEDAQFNIKVDSQGRSYVGIPLETNGFILGGLTLITYPGQAVTVEGTSILKAMGQQIGLAVLNAIRFQQARYQATLEERERLAREMHDSLAQALGYLKMKASATDDLLSGGQIDQAQVSLREVKEIARETYFDVRETIFSLRNTSTKGRQFLPSLEEYLDKYRLHYGLQVHVTTEENCRPAFSPETSIQLTRIIQEALTNVRKHAGLAEATVRFARVDHHWDITVEDSGVGFDARETKSEGWRFLGLHIMQERAEGIGADLQVDSHPGAGTRVMIRVPFETEA